jgi:hypothetical protein
MVWLKRAVLLLLFAMVTLIGLSPVLLVMGMGEMALDGGGASPVVGTGLVSVVTIFLLDVFVLWVLSKIGGPLKAEVKASIKKFGGSIWLTGAGLVGCFLAIAIIGIAGAYFLGK